MIHLTRLNGNPLVVNSDLIKYAESSPDTLLTLISGEKIIVLESCEDVVSRTMAYRGRVLAEAAGNLETLPWTTLPPPAGLQETAPPAAGTTLMRS